jgi:dTDP-4-dehydrorhamnose 3,5-epimerase
MIFTPTSLAGAFIVDIEPRHDERGFFARAYCARDFERRGLSALAAQGNIAFNYRKGTTRGLHFQSPPAAEAKLVRCTRGAMFDIIVDLRPESATYLQHVAVELTADNRRALYVPERFAHGYQALEDDTETTYQMGAFYTPSAQGGLRVSDPRLAIPWPLSPTDVSEKDRSWPLLDDVEAAIRARMAVSAPPLVAQSREPAW